MEEKYVQLLISQVLYLSNKYNDVIKINKENIVKTSMINKQKIKEEKIKIKNNNIQPTKISRDPINLESNDDDVNDFDDIKINIDDDIKVDIVDDIKIDINDDLNDAPIQNVNKPIVISDNSTKTTSCIEKSDPIIPPKKYIKKTKTPSIKPIVVDNENYKKLLFEKYYEQIHQITNPDTLIDYNKITIGSVGLAS